MALPTQDPPATGAAERILRVAIAIIYGRRRTLFCVLLAITVVMLVQAMRLGPDAGYEKQIPLSHPYMQTFRQYQQTFGGANLVSIALVNEAGDIYDERFLDALKTATDAVFFLPGVDRSRVTSLFTPGVRYIEVIEDGFESGDVVPRDYTPSPESLALIRANVAKAGIIGRLVAADQHGALIVAELLEHDPTTGEKLDYVAVASRLEDIRGRFENPQRYELRAKKDLEGFARGDVVSIRYADPRPLLPGQRLRADPPGGGEPVYVAARDLEVVEQANPFHDPQITAHIIGFAKVVGDVTDANIQVSVFFFVALLLTVILLWMFCGTLRLALLPLGAAICAVIWELGLLHTCGFGLDPFAILVPFLILSIGVSHGVQYVNAWGHEVSENGLDPYHASLESFRRLFIPGTVAIITNVIGFGTLAFIQIDIVQEMAINAALGMAAVIVTNKTMLPIALTWVKLADVERFRAQMAFRQKMGDRVWRHVAKLATARGALPALAISAVAFGWALHKYPDLTVGDTLPGVPELKPESRYNRDALSIAQRFYIGVDLLKVIGETHEYGCVDGKVMQALDRYAWRMQNTPGVALAAALPLVVRTVSQAVHEGDPRWAIVPRREGALSQATSKVPSGLGLANTDCSAMPVLIYTTDHKAETIAGIVAATKAFNEENPSSETGIVLRLASGNVGVMAATNEEIRARELLVIIWVHATLGFFAWLSFRTAAAVIGILTPLVLCSLLTYGLMATLGVGMKPATLPVAAFGVGIGVDYSIYLWAGLRWYLERGLPLQQAYYEALRHTGKAVAFTSASLIISVFTWLFSGLQFQADMGLLLLFMFTTNVFGALLLLPALAWLVLDRSMGGEKNGVRVVF